MVTQSEEAITLMTFYRLIQGSYGVGRRKELAGVRGAIEDTRLP